jgi:hypothetical protein
MLECKELGLAKAVGVSNFGVSHLKKLKSEGLEVPEVNQVELHCWHQQKQLVAYHEKESIMTMVGRAPAAAPAKPSMEHRVCKPSLDCRLQSARAGKPPFLVVKRPARPYKGPIQSAFPTENANAA